MRKNTTIKKFGQLEKIGEGAFCTVYKATRIQDNKIYALKIVSISKLKSKELENAMNEIQLLS